MNGARQWATVVFWLPRPLRATGNFAFLMETLPRTPSPREARQRNFLSVIHLLVTTFESFIKKLCVLLSMTFRDIGSLVSDFGQKAKTYGRYALSSAALIAGLVGTAPESKGLILDLQSITQNANDDWELNLGLINDNSGTNYTSVEIGENFLQSLWNDSRFVDQSAYSNQIANFIAAADPQFFISGGIDTGWNSNTNSSTGKITLSHDAGDPGFDYEEYLYNVNPSSATMFGSLRIKDESLVSGTNLYTAALNPQSVGFTLSGIAYDGVSAEINSTSNPIVYGNSPELLSLNLVLGL